MTPKEKPAVSDAVAIERERQKTKRYIMFLLVFAAVAIIGIFVVFVDSETGGKRRVDINLAEGKLSLSVDKPIVEQVKLPTSSYNAAGRTVEFTTGEIDPSVLQDLPNYESIQPTSFTGKNFINREAGFLLAIDNPSLWQVTYNPDGMYNPLSPVNTIYTHDGTHLNVNIEQVPSGTGLEEYVNASLQTLIASGMMYQLPEVSFDDASGSAFFYHVNPLTDGRTFQKIVLKHDTAYIASANYNESISDPDRVDDLIEMVSTFAVIGV
jgi:hypothetical protein